LPGPRLPWVSPEVVAQILTIGADRLPLEACGVIPPDQQVVETPNSHPTPTKAYAIDVEDLGNAILAYVGRSGVHPHDLSREHFIVWHTHPLGSVGPSQGDLDTRVEGFRYVVVSMPQGPATKF